MKRALVQTTFAALLLILASCSRSSNQKARTDAAQSVPGAVPSVRLISPIPDREWRLPAGDFANTRFSSLGQINAGNVRNLKMVSTMATGIPNGHEGQPLVVNNTMYVVTPFPNLLMAIDLSRPNGPLRWTFDPHADPTAVGIACCDVVNRGASYADGKIIYATLDDYAVAVNAETGKEEWRTKVGDINQGETVTMAPLAVKNLVLVGNSGSELGVRGKMVALEVSTGREVWRAYNTGPDNEVRIGDKFKAFYQKDQGQNLGVSTWPKDQWKLGGSTVWGWVSYDPELNLIFYGTANPGVWNPELRPGDNKWSLSIFARDLNTGDARWAYQITPHDSWDYDEIMENILIDMDFGGRMRKLLLHPARNGFMFVLDRETGEVLSAEIFEKSTNWATGYDLKTGLPKEDPAKRTKMGVVTQNICPSSTGGKEFVPSAFSPRTGLLYIPAHNTCMNYEAVQANYIAGTPYLGASVKMFQGPGGYHGELIAWDVHNARAVWSVKEPLFPVYSGVLATAGDVVFYGTMDGYVKAVDARKGDVLWQFKTGSGVIGNPITFLGPDGKQYIAIYSGIGGWMGTVAFSSVSTDDDYAVLGAVGAMKKIKDYTAPGGQVYVFGL